MALDFNKKSHNMHYRYHGTTILYSKSSYREREMMINYHEMESLGLNKRRDRDSEQSGSPARSYID